MTDKKEMTICAKCKNLKLKLTIFESWFVHFFKTYGSVQWYDFYCKKSSSKSYIDVLDGKEKLPGNIKYINCRDINDGNCEDYQSK